MRGDTILDRDGEAWDDEVRARLQARGKQRPLAKSRQIKILWPEICAALENGQTLKSIREWLEESGVVVTYSALTSYVSRIRRRANMRSIESNGSICTANPAGPSTSPATGKHQEAIVTTPEKNPDPLKNVRDRNANRPGFEYPPGVDEDSLI